MVTQKHHLFRKEALERSASPERLDQLMQVVSPNKWLSLAALGILAASGLVWSIVGRIPITVTGQGAVVYPSRVVSAQSSSSGRLKTIKIQVGDMVKKGEVLATIDQSDLQKQLQLAQAKLAQLQLQDQMASSLQTQRQQLDQQAIAQQRQAIQQSLQATQLLTPVLREKGLESIQRDRENLRHRLQAMQELLPTLEKRVNSRQHLLREGAGSSDMVLQARQDYLNGLAQLDDAASQLKQLDVKEADAQRQYLQNLNSVTDLQSQLKELNSKIATQAQQDLQTITNRKKEIQDTQRLIAQLQQQLTNSQITSNYDGRVLEVTATPGQVLEPGQRIGSIAAEDSTAKLVSIAFFSVSDGKKIQKDMKLQVTPSTVKREEFGGIVGTVTDISAFPVTKEGATRLIGNPDIVQGIMSQGPQIQVSAELQPDASTFSQFHWSSSQGPHLQLSSGTTTSVRVIVSERAPITFVLPILKSWSGID